jgi:hypothetical protein
LEKGRGMGMGADRGILGDSCEREIVQPLSRP